MTSFDRQSIQRTAEDWLALAEHANEESGKPTLIATVGVIGGLALASLTATPIAGLVPAGWAFYEAWKINDRKSKSDEGIAVGCVAHVLSGTLFHQFRRQAGDEALYDQLAWAEDEGLPMTRDAQDYLEWYRQFKQQQPALAPAQEPIASQSQPVQQQSAIGSNTRLNAVPVAASVVREAQEFERVFELPDPPADSFTSSDSPVDYLIGDRPRTSLIVAVSGGGKDYLLSNAVRRFIQVHPGFKVVVMDCKDDPKEYGYFEGLPNVSVRRINLATATDGEATRWIDSCVDEFNNLQEKALLICNEGTLTRSKSKRYIDAVAGLVSSGDSREKYVWEAGQSAHTDDLGINGAARSRFRPLVIGLSGEEMQVQAILQAKFVADSARDMNEIKSLMNRSPVNRAWCDGQHWYAMPELENYCGYDRDTRSYVGVLNGSQEQVEAIGCEEGGEIDLESLIAMFEEVFPFSVPAQAILDKVEQQGKGDEWIDARWVQQYVFYTKDLKHLTAEDVRQCFAELVEGGRGIMEISKWRLNPL